ncbi:MAG: ATP-binding cassette domain-containing protein [Dermatophilaceae bacterium]
MSATDVVVEGLTQGYGRRQVLFDITCTFERGLTALLGLNGAGKTTLIRSLVGDLRPRSGSIRLGDRQMTNGWDRDQLAVIGYLPQDPRLPGHMRVRDAIAYAQWLKCGTGGQARRIACLDAVGLVSLADSRVGSLSGGMKRRLALACATVAHPRLLLLDEPTVGLDPEQRSSLRELIQASAADCAVVFSTHELGEVDHLDPLVLVIDHGRIGFSGSADDLRQRAPSDASPQKRLELGFLSLIAARG